MGCEPDVVHGRPCDPPGCAASTNPSLSCVPPLSLVSTSIEGRRMRFIGSDVHRDFCEVAIAEAGRLRSAGRIETRVESLELFAQSLEPDDQVALEATSGAPAIAALIEPHVARVVVANTRKLAAISQAKAKTDRLDARTLARLLASGYLEEVWAPDEQTRALRRLTSRRARLVRARTRAKNETHGVLARNLCDRPPVVHLFSKAGRRWLAELELPVDERLTLGGCLRRIDFLDGEIAALDGMSSSCSPDAVLADAQPAPLLARELGRGPARPERRVTERNDDPLLEVRADLVGHPRPAALTTIQRFQAPAIDLGLQAVVGRPIDAHRPAGLGEVARL